MKITRITLLLCLVVTAFSLCLSGCAGLKAKSAHYGEMRPSGVVAESFAAYTVKNDHTYYISGSVSQPNAIMGIDNRYTLVTSLWKRVILVDKPHPYVQRKEETLKYYVNGMEAKVAEFDQTLHGFDIIDNRGNDIGDWYSILEARMPVQMLGHGRIAIVPPPLGLYERYEGEGDEGKIWLLR